MHGLGVRCPGFSFALGTEGLKECVHGLWVEVSGIFLFLVCMGCGVRCPDFLVLGPEGVKECTCTNGLWGEGSGVVFFGRRVLCVGCGVRCPGFFPTVSVEVVRFSSVPPPPSFLPSSLRLGCGDLFARESII